MKSTVRMALVAVIAFSLTAAASCERKTSDTPAGAVGGGKVSWKMASAFPATLPIVGTAGPYFTGKVKRLSRGRIEIKFFDPGKLVPALEIFDAVSKGSVDAGWSAAGYWIGKIPAAAFFTAVPFGPDTNEYLGWILHGGGLELWRELYAVHNVFPIPCQLTPPEASGWFREPITDVAQFKGMKIRFFGLGGQAVQKLGASVQLLAGADIYPALERGVLDATEFAMPSMDERFGFSKIAKHYYFPGWHQQSSIAEFIVNMDRWNELDAVDQEFLETVCRDTMIRDVALGETQQAGALSRIKQDGVELHYWSDEILSEFNRAWQLVIEENSAQDPDDFHAMRKRVIVA